jgi:hypothetical protein
LEGRAIEELGTFHGGWVYFIAIWYILLHFGLVKFPPFWYLVPRKIWQPCPAAAAGI